MGDMKELMSELVRENDTLTQFAEQAQNEIEIRNVLICALAMQLGGKRRSFDITNIEAAQKKVFVAVGSEDGKSVKLTLKNRPKESKPEE